MKKVKPNKLGRRILSIVLTVALMAGLIPGNMMTVSAEESTSTPLSVTAFATQEQLTNSNNFALHSDTGSGKAQKVYFGKNGDSQQTWYIAGSDADDSIVLLCDPALPMATKTVFENDGSNNKTYDSSWNCFYGTEPSEVYPNHYGASDLRLNILKTLETDTSVFTKEEQSMMQSTQVCTDDDKLKDEGKSEYTYYTEDVLYAAYGDSYGCSYITVGANSADSLNGELKVSLKSVHYNSEDIFWLRAPWDVDSAGDYARVVASEFGCVSDRVCHIGSVVPAFRLKLSSVRFASAAPAATSGASLTDTMTLRVDGYDKITSKAYYTTDGVMVDVADEETVYLYVQGNNGTTDWVYSQEISEDGTVETNNIMTDAKDKKGTTVALSTLDLNQCKIWIEKKEDNLVYALMARKIETETVTTVAVTDITAPVAGDELDTTASCVTTGVSNTTPTLTWSPTHTIAGYNTSYTTSVTLTHEFGYVFADNVTATVNGEDATSIKKNDDGTITVTYEFSATDQLDITQTNVKVDTLTYTGEAQTPKFTLTLGNTTLTVDDYDVTVTAQTNAGDNYEATITGKGNWEGTIANVVWSIGKATPYIETTPTAADITFGQSVSDSTLTGGTVQHSVSNNTTVAGTWSWKETTTKPIVADSEVAQYDVVFTPNDTENYNEVETKITLTVNKSETTPNMPEKTMSALYSQKTVGAVELPEGWVWNDADSAKELTVAKAVEATAIYNGADKGNYVTERVKISITRQDCDHVESGILYTGDGEKAPTCTEAGIGHTECTKCKEPIQTNVSVESTAHTWDNGVITKEATATEKGEKTYTCSVCKTTKAEEIPALGAPEVGTAITSEDGSATYKVTEAGEDGNAVTYEAPIDKNATTVEVPATITINNITYNVTTISDTAFAGNKKITSVTIGDNVTEFSAKTFKGCTNLKTVDVGNGVTSIPVNAFKNFKKLTTVKMGTEVETIGKNAFSGCSKLKNLTIGKNVTTISDKSFYKCTSLTKVTIPSKVKTIGKSAFSGCKKLKTVTVGKSVAKIGSKAFYGCSKMKTLTIKSTKLTAKKIGSKAFTKTPKNMTVKVPKKKFEAYKSMLIKCGVNKKAKFKKS